jgi:hypothetical protein
VIAPIPITGRDPRIWLPIEGLPGDGVYFAGDRDSGVGLKLLGGCLGAQFEDAVGAELLIGGVEISV